MEIIVGRQGNQRLSITDLTVSKRHCRITQNQDGSYSVENLSQSTYTKVDGREIIKARATLNSEIQLGPHYKTTLGALIGARGHVGPTNTGNDSRDTVSGPHGPQGGQRPPGGQNGQPATYNIAHLKRIYDDFERKNLELAEKQRKINQTRTGLGILTMCAMPTIFFLGPVGYALTGIGVIGNIFSFIGMKNSESAADRKRRQDAFDDAWVCPNPDCARTLPAKNYKLLKRNHQSCPYCKCRYVERR